MPAAAVDVLIRGAGPVGCTLALALRGSGLNLRLLDFPAGNSSSSKLSVRPIALSHASRLILERVGIWSSLEPTRIETIHVSQAGGFGRATLQAADAGVPALGYVVEYSELASALRAACAELITGDEAPAQCVVHAEGASAEAKETRYGQDALVALVRTEPAAQSAAFERFTAEGPLALLPLAGRYALVWSMRPERAAGLAAAPEAHFLAALADAAGSRPGRPA